MKLLIILALLNFSWADEDVCFSEATTTLIKQYAPTKMDTDSKLTALSNTCEELQNSDMYKKKNILSVVMDNVANAAGVGVMFGLGAGSFSDVDSTETQKKFKSELDRIKLVPERMERIRLTYLLVSKYQGAYDFETMGKKTDFVGGKMVGALRPENLIDMAEKHGTSGVCRHFSALLYWSLVQVSRLPDSKGGALTEEEFSPSYMVGEVPIDDIGGWGGHAWIRVNLPYRNADGALEFDHIELDTTFYPGVFSILQPRRTGLKNKVREELVSDCERAKQCLMRQYLENRSDRQPAATKKNKK